MLLDTGLYLHIPFCLKKCKYCDFLSFAATDAQKRQYTDALIREIEALSPFAADRCFSTIYFGGGTPTLLGKGLLLRIISAIERSFLLHPQAEFTVEANPETLDFALLKALKTAGVNRISLGVQSMNNAILKKIGRVHDVNRVLECYAALRLAGFENVSYDLIFALPDQTEQDFLSSVSDLLKLSPVHLSLYSLQLEEGTPLFEQQSNFHFADEQTERNMYYRAREMLKAHGLQQYEISNFAKPGFESRHNTRYWDCGEYLGAGLGASSYFNGVRYQNPDDLHAYLNFTSQFKPLFRDNPPLTTQEKMSEFFILGLRKTQGVDLDTFRQRFNTAPETIFGTTIKKHLQNGLLHQEGQRLFLSERGLDLANQVMQDFV